MTNTATVANADLPLYGELGMTFMQFPIVRNLQDSDAEVVVSGVPFDMATTGRPGSRLGPQGVRQASANLIWEGARWPWDFALDDHLKVADSGNVLFRHGEPQTMVDALTGHIGSILKSGKSALTFGGDHFISLPILRAYAVEHGPVALIHVDAHTDTYSGGSQYDHGTIFHHAVEEGLIDTEHSIQIGIRTAYDKKNHPFEVLDAAWVGDHSAADVVERIRQRTGDKKVYLSFDIDGIDPAFAPGTGTPVAAGISIDCALKMVRGLQGLDLIGMDLVEVAPAYDHAEITCLAGATLALEYLYVLAANKQQK
ncbi:agmatinase [Oceanospirillum sediminis]|uniref:Agmatinase n=1 Tax=Oceanospirillum sediminis TaxID=2760088 RepID=A0A839IW24_9GAMM|nr:agmatinase [Oceanospirillum sediminis]MBB1489623.1 agmatinase [Oceanospirillum sediminis]